MSHFTLGQWNKANKRKRDLGRMQTLMPQECSCILKIVQAKKETEKFNPKKGNKNEHTRAN